MSKLAHTINAPSLPQRGHTGNRQIMITATSSSASNTWLNVWDPA